MALLECSVANFAESLKNARTTRTGSQTQGNLVYQFDPSDSCIGQSFLPRHRTLRTNLLAQFRFTATFRWITHIGFDSLATLREANALCPKMPLCTGVVEGGRWLLVPSTYTNSVWEDANDEAVRTALCADQNKA